MLISRQQLQRYVPSPRYGAHATDGLTPPIHLSKGVVQLHVSGAGCVRTGVVADNSVKAEHDLHENGTGGRGNRQQTL